MIITFSSSADDASNVPVTVVSGLCSTSSVWWSSDIRSGCGFILPSAMVIYTCTVAIQSCQLLSSRSMVPDVIDAAVIEKGARREELFYSFFVFGNKFSAGITIAISTGIYK